MRQRKLFLWRSVAWVLAVAVMSGSLASPRVYAREARPQGDGAAQAQQRRVEQQSGIYLPLISPVTCPLWGSQFSRSVFGVQMYGATGPETAQYCEMMASGARFVRAEIGWAGAQPNISPAGQYNWAGIDRVAQIAKSGAVVILTILSAPEWAAQESQGPIRADHVDEFAAFVKALVERYDGDGQNDAPGSPVVRYFELYNEPDNISSWGREGDQYAAMLKAVYPKVKEASPEAKVLLGGIAYDWFTDQRPTPGPFVRSFLDDVLEAGGGSYFDVMNFHVYPVFWMNWGDRPPGVVEKTDAIRAKLGEHGVSKPIIITESGAHSNCSEDACMTPEIQANYVVQLFTQARAAQVDVMTWFSLVDPPGDYPHRNGLVTDARPPSRKRSFIAYQTAVRQLGNAEYVREVGVAEVAEAGSPDAGKLLIYEFVNNGRTLYVSWTTQDDPTADNAVEQKNTLRLFARRVLVRDIYDAQRTVADGDDGAADGFVSVTVGARPLYIEVTN